MNSMATVRVVAEGQTEQAFTKNVLAPELGKLNVFITAALIGRPGKKGGDIRFEKAANDIGRFLKQQPDLIVTTMFDFFRIDSKWPGLSDIAANMTAHQIGDTIEQATYAAIIEKIPDLTASERFIPYISMHEFEALLFSSPKDLADGIDTQEVHVQNIVNSCGEPEEINTGPQTAPAKRIESLCPRKYKKRIEGPSIAQTIGLETIRQQCPHFNSWLVKLEALVD